MDQGREISLTNLNTLNYAAAVATTWTTLTEHVQIKLNHDQNATIKKYIEKTRKTIGWLLVIQRGARLTEDEENYWGQSNRICVRDTSYASCSSK